MVKMAKDIKKERREKVKGWKGEKWKVELVKFTRHLVEREVKSNYGLKESQLKVKSKK